MSKRENNVCMVHWHNEQHNYDSWETAVHIDELGIAHIDNVCAFKPSKRLHFTKLTIFDMVFVLL